MAALSTVRIVLVFGMVAEPSIRRRGGPRSRVGTFVVFAVVCLSCADALAAEVGPDSPTGCGELKAIVFDSNGNLQAQWPPDNRAFWRAATEECRRAVDANPDSSLATAIRAPLQSGGGPLSKDAAGHTALAAICALHPRWALPTLLRALDEGSSPGCLAGLAETNALEAQAAVDQAIGNVFWRHPTPGVVDPPWQLKVDVLAAAELSASLRAKLAPLLALAFERRARGYDGLRDLVCADTGGRTILTHNDCARFPRLQEGHWRERRELTRNVKLTIASIAAAGVAVTAAALTRNDDAGRFIAAGTATGGVAMLTYTLSVRSTRGEDALAQTMAPIYGAIWAAALAIPAGITTYLATKEPGAAPVIATSAGAALWLVGSLTLIWD
jgi:hypothetical protein